MARSRHSSLNGTQRFYPLFRDPIYHILFCLTRDDLPSTHKEYMFPSNREAFFLSVPSCSSIHFMNASLPIFLATVHILFFNFSNVILTSGRYPYQTFYPPKLKLDFCWILLHSFQLDGKSPACAQDISRKGEVPHIHATLWFH